MRCFFLVGMWSICASAAAQRPELVVQSGHLSDINDLAFSPDGNLMATCGDDFTIKIWDLQTEKLVRSISTNSEMHAVWFTPINQKTGRSTSVIAAGIEDSLYSFTQYGIATGASGFSSLMAGTHVTGMAYAYDWQTFAFAFDNYIFLGDTLDGTEMVQISHKDVPDKKWTALAFAHEHEWLAAATFGLGDNRIVIWDVSKGQRIVMEMPLVWEVVSLTFTNDDRYLLLEAAYGEDSAIGIIDVASAETVGSWTGRDLAYSEAHNDLLFCTASGVRVFDIDSMKFDQLWTFGLGVPSGLDVAPDGKTFAVSWGTEVYMDDYFTGDIIRELFGSRQLSSFTLFNPQGDKLIFNSIGGYLNIWNGRTGKLERMLEHDDYITIVDYDTAGDYLATVGYDSMLVMWDLNADTVLWKAKQPSADFYSISFTPPIATDEPPAPRVMIMVGSEMRFYQSATGEYLEDLTANLGEDGFGAAYGPVGQHIVILSEDSLQAMALDDSDGMLVSSGARYLTVTFDPKETHVVASRMDSILAWRLTDGALVKAFTFPGRSAGALAFTVDGQVMAAGYDNGDIVIWDFETAEVISRINTGQNHIYGLSFSRNRRFLASSSLDGNVQLIDANSFRKIASIYTFPDGSWAVIDSAGRYDASDGTNIPHLHYRVDLDTVPFEYEFIELKQLSSRYWDPDLLQEHLGFTSEPLKDVGSFDNIAIYPSITLEGSTNSLLKIRLTNRGGGIGSVKVAINNKEIDHNLVVANADAGSADLSLDLYLHPALVPDSVNVVSVSVFNKEGSLESSADTVHVKQTGLSKARQRLFALVVGVSNYQGDEIDLRFASRDAESFERTLRIGAQRMFGVAQTHIIRLTTDADDPGHWPNKKNIQQAFERLQQQATSQDLLVMYFSGHGVQHDDDWYFLTADAMSFELTDASARESQTISGTELYEWIKGIPRSNQALILDACASGKVADDISSSKSALSEAQRIALEELMNNQEMFVLAGSAAQGKSHEADIFGQGLLTFTLLESLKNGEGIEGQYLADVARMFDYADRMVPTYAALIRETQDPVRRVPPSGNSFALGVFTDSMREEIPLPKPRPIFSRTIMDDDVLKTDHLELSSKVDQYLERMRVQEDGHDLPALMLVKSEDLPGAFRVRGEYEVKNGSISLTVWVFRSNVQLTTFKLKGSEVSQMAAEVVNRALAELAAQGLL